MKKHNKLETINTRLKHLRGRHNQLDHAWNRGMGRGGGGAALAPNQMGPLPTQDFYRKRLANLTEQQRRGEITRADMRQQMRDLRGITRQENNPVQPINPVLSNAQQASLPVLNLANRQIPVNQQLPSDLILNNSMTVGNVNNVIANTIAELFSIIPNLILPQNFLNANPFLQDMERFRSDYPDNSRILRRLPVMRNMTHNSSDFYQSSATLNDTLIKMRKTIGTDAFKIGYLEQQISLYTKAIDTYAKSPFKNTEWTKNAINDAMQKLADVKEKYYEAKKSQADTVLGNFMPEKSSSSVKPNYEQSVPNEIKTQLEPLFDRFSRFFQQGMLLSSQTTGQPLNFSVSYEDMGVNGNLAECFEVKNQYGGVIGIKIRINSATTDQTTLASSVYHEMSHVLQFTNDPSVMAPHWEYLQERLNGEVVQMTEDGDIFVSDLFTRSYQGMLHEVQFKNNKRLLSRLKKGEVLVYGVDDGLPLPYEVLSTGIEQFLIDPVNLMMSDPDLFTHLSSFMSGKASQFTNLKLAPFNSTTAATTAVRSGTTPSTTSTVTPAGTNTTVIPNTSAAIPFVINTSDIHMSSALPISATSGDSIDVDNYEVINERKHGKPVRVSGRRKSQYIDEIDPVNLPQELKNNPQAIRELAYLQRQFDAALSDLSPAYYPETATEINDAIENDDDIAAQWQEERLKAAKIAAQMYVMYPDAKLLNDIESILTDSNGDAYTSLDPNLNTEMFDMLSFVDYYSSPYMYPTVPQTDPATGKNIINEVDIPVDLQKYGHPGQHIFGARNFYNLPGNLVAIESPNSIQKMIRDGVTSPGNTNYSFFTDGATYFDDIDTTDHSYLNIPKTLSIDEINKRIAASTAASSTPATPRTPRVTKPVVLPSTLNPLDYLDPNLVTGTTFSTPTIGLVGNETVASTSPTTNYRVRYRVMDKKDIKTSHSPDGRPNSEYDQSLQPRARERAAYQMQVNNIAANLSPVNLLTGSTAQSGPPVINKDGMVLSGNGRMMALQLVDDDAKYPGKKDSYKNQLIASASEFGFDPNEIAAMDNPVLVREIADDAPVNDFVQQSNTTETSAYSPLEAARNDALNLSPDILSQFNPLADNDIDEYVDIDRALLAPENAEFVRSFISKVPAGERAQLVDKSGALNELGRMRIKAAMLYSAFKDEEGQQMVQSLVDSIQTDMRNLRSALQSSMPTISSVSADVQSNTISPTLDPTPDIAKAINTLLNVGKNSAYSGTLENKLDTFLNQSQAAGMESDLSDTQIALAKFIAQNIRSPRKIGYLMNKWMSKIRQSTQVGQMSLLDPYNVIQPGDIDLLNSLLGIDSGGNLLDMLNGAISEMLASDTASKEVNEPDKLWSALYYLKLYKEYNRPITPRKKYFNYIFGVGS